MFFVFEDKKHWKTTLLVPYVCLKALFFAGSIIGFDPYPCTYIMHIFCYIKSLKCQPKPWLMINYHSRVQAWKYLWRTCHRLHIYQSWLLLSHLSLILSPSPSLSMYNHIHNILPWFMTQQWWCRIQYFASRTVSYPSPEWMSAEQLIPLCLDGIEVLGQPVWITARPKLHSAFRFFNSLVPNEFPKTMFQPWKGPPWDHRESHSHITWRCQVEASRRSARLCIEDRFWGPEDLFGILVEPLLKQSCQHHDKSSATSLSAGTSVVWSPFSHPGICKPLGENALPPDDSKPLLSLSLSLKSGAGHFASQGSSKTAWILKSGDGSVLVSPFADCTVNVHLQASQR